MSQPNIKAELHEAVGEYVNKFLGEDSLSHYLHDEIDHPEKRTWLYDEFIEYVESLN